MLFDQGRQCSADQFWLKSRVTHSTRSTAFGRSRPAVHVVLSSEPGSFSHGTDRTIDGQIESLVKLRKPTSPFAVTSKESIKSMHLEW